jgi:hypothetical protein
LTNYETIKETEKAFIEGVFVWMDPEEAQRQRRAKVKEENERAERQELEARKARYFLREAVTQEDSVQRKEEARQKVQEARAEEELKKTRSHATTDPKVISKRYDTATSLIPSDPAKAIALLTEIAEETGHAASCYALGEHYILQDTQDELALRYMRAAADQDYCVKASTATGLLLSVKRLHGEAKRYFEKAARKGDQDAIAELRKPEYQTAGAFVAPPRPKYWWDRQPELDFNAAKTKPTGNQ